MARSRLRWLGDRLRKVLPEERPEAFDGTERVDAVQRDMPLQELVGESREGLKNLLLLLVAQIDPGTGEQRPARRHPQDDFSSRARGFARKEFLQILQGLLKTFVRSVDPLRGTDRAQTHRRLIKGDAEGVAIRRKTLAHLHAPVGQYRESGRISQVAAIGAQKLVDLAALESDVLIVGVHAVND